MKVDHRIRDMPCIYVIMNMINRKMYVGKTKCLYQRSYQYRTALKKNDTRQINEYLLKAIAKDGVENFLMFPLEFITRDGLANKELEWMITLGTLDRAKGYNLRFDSSSATGVVQSTSDKIRNNLKRQWASGVRDGHSAKLKESWKGRDRTEQSARFSAIKTKYEYVVTFPDGKVERCRYLRLVSLGLRNTMTALKRSGKDNAMVKKHHVQRVTL